MKGSISLGQRHGSVPGNVRKLAWRDGLHIDEESELCLWVNVQV